MIRKITAVSVALALVIVQFPSFSHDADAAPIRGNAQYQVWTRTDAPVADGSVDRTWMWGPEALSGQLLEQYEEGRGGSRIVQYFDKSRMEVTDPDADASSPWYVTNGLLALELITGRMQVGDARFEDHTPAEINVAGDSNDPSGPTYRTFSRLLDREATSIGTVITSEVDRAGQVTEDPALAQYNVTAAYHVPETDHTVASVFWDFVNSEDLVRNEYGDLVHDRLFENPFYATGLPVTEAYWTDVLVGGEQRRVLVQAFERRVLTYTPSNPPGWTVEAGNVGRHYYHWRYGDLILPGAESQEYYTEFNDWPQGSHEVGSVSRHPLGYRVNVIPEPGAWLLANSQGENFRDVEFNLELERVSTSPDSSGCLLARYQQFNGNGYRLCLDGSGRSYADIGRFAEGEFDVTQTLLEPRFRHGTLPTEQENRVQIVVSGPNTWFLVNGHFIGSFHDPSAPAAGEAGVIVVNSSAQPAEWQFNFLQTRNVVP